MGNPNAKYLDIEPVFSIDKQKRAMELAHNVKRLRINLRFFLSFFEQGHLQEEYLISSGIPEGAWIYQDTVQLDPQDRSVLTMIVGHESFPVVKDKDNPPTLLLEVKVGPTIVFETLDKETPNAIAMSDI